ncbi:hypothetical protein [Streptomyces olivoreticuli]|uniref:hypothetical protein n=1 Tax=Streptomyces olivoreticuli TaxID=68246 RepID=UPI0013C2E1EA|nr:hypothetical protein [Streptomyces olivoreticuli]
MTARPSAVRLEDLPNPLEAGLRHGGGYIAVATGESWPAMVDPLPHQDTEEGTERDRGGLAALEEDPTVLVRLHTSSPGPPSPSPYISVA